MEIATSTLSCLHLTRQRSPPSERILISRYSLEIRGVLGAFQFELHSVYEYTIYTSILDPLADVIYVSIVSVNKL